jgi:hypothetical protein
LSRKSTHTGHDLLVTRLRLLDRYADLDREPVLHGLVGHRLLLGFCPPSCPIGARPGLARVDASDQAGPDGTGGLRRRTLAIIFAGLSA